MSEQKQVTPIDSNLQAFLFRFQKIEDRLVLACLPVVIFSLVLWSIASAFPVIGTVVNLVITILMLLVVCVMLLRLIEIGWRWVSIGIAQSDGDDPTYIFGVLGIVLFLIGGVVCLIDMVIHAGSVAESRSALFVGVLLLLALQYRAIIYRHLRGTVNQEASNSVESKEK